MDSAQSLEPYPLPGTGDRGHAWGDRQTNTLGAMAWQAVLGGGGGPAAIRRQYNRRQGSERHHFPSTRWLIRLRRRHRRVIDRSHLRAGRHRTARGCRRTVTQGFLPRQMRCWTRSVAQLAVEYAARAAADAADYRSDQPCSAMPSPTPWFHSFNSSLDRKCLGSGL